MQRIFPGLLGAGIKREEYKSYAVLAEAVLDRASQGEKGAVAILRVDGITGEVKRPYVKAVFCRAGLRGIRTGVYQLKKAERPILALLFPSKKRVERIALFHASTAS